MVHTPSEQGRGWLPKAIWEVYRSRDVQALLQAALPYLIIKRDKAEAMLTVFEEVYGLPRHTTAPMLLAGQK